MFWIANRGIHCGDHAQTPLAERLAELNLYAALGGGWQEAPPAASAGSPIPALSPPLR
jgi:hypothetical protein